MNSHEKEKQKKFWIFPACLEIIVVVDEKELAGKAAGFIFTNHYQTQAPFILSS